MASTHGRTLAYSREPLSVRVYEGRTGVVHYKYSATVETEQGQRASVSGAWTEVYIEGGAVWLMVAVSGRPNTASATGAA